MPKLPTWQNVARPDIPRPNRLAEIPDSIAGAQAASARRMGNAIAGAGKQIGAAFEEKEEEASRLDLIERDAEWNEKIKAFRRGFDKDYDYKTYGQRWKTGSDAITSSVAEGIKDPKIRKEFMLRRAARAQEMEEGLYRQGQRIREEEVTTRLNESLRQSVDTYADPASPAESRAWARVDVDQRIKVLEDAGEISPAKAQELRSKAKREMFQRHLDNRVKTEPATVLEELKTYETELAAGKEARTRGPAGLEIKPYEGERRTGRPRGKPVRGVIAHYTEGGTDMDGLASWANESNMGYNYYIDRDGNVIEFAGDDVVMNHAGQGRRRPGDKAPHLGNGNTVGIGIMTPRGGTATPAQIEAFRKLTGQLAQRHGFDEKAVFGHGEVAIGHRKSTEAMDVVGAVREKGFEKPEPEEGAEPEAADPNMPPQEIIRRQEIAETFDALKPEDRYKLRVEAERALKVQTAVNRRELRAQMKSDLANIRQDGVPSNDFDPGNLPEDLREGHESARKRAYVFHGATHDAPELSEGQMQDRLAKLREELIKPGDPNRAANDTLMRDVEREYEAVQKMRREDPAAAVDSHPIVEAAKGSMYEGTMDREQWQDLLDARKEAQVALGIDPNNQHVLTRQEAYALLPDLRDVPPEQVPDVIRQAAFKAQETYGPDYAKRAMLDALAFRKQLKGLKVEMEYALENSGLSKGDVRYIKRNMEAAEQYGTDDFMADDAIAPGMGGLTPPERIEMTEGQTAPMPTVAAFEYAKSRGAVGARAFDQMFGAGAYKRAEEYLSQQAR